MLKGLENWIWTDHIEWQMWERNISPQTILAVLNNPDEIIPGKKGRRIFQKLTKGKLVRVVVEDQTLITVYITDKLEKYLRGHK